MAKNYYFLLLVLLNIPIIVGADSQADLRRCVIATAQSQVGVRELTGHNDGVEVERYLRYVGLPKGNPYCSAGLCWTYAQSCIDNPHNALAASWFTDKNRIVYDRRFPKKTKEIKAGCTGGIYFNSMGGIHHVFMVVKWGDSFESGVEFNSNTDGGRDGDGVYCKKRLIKQVYQVSDYIQ